MSNIILKTFQEFNPLQMTDKKVKFARYRQYSYSSKMIKAILVVKSLKYYL